MEIVQSENGVFIRLRDTVMSEVKCKKFKRSRGEEAWLEMAEKYGWTKME